VTNTRVFGYGEFSFNPADGGKASFDNPVPSGYVSTGLWKLNAAWEVISSGSRRFLLLIADGFLWEVGKR